MLLLYFFARVCEVCVKSMCDGGRIGQEMAVSKEFHQIYFQSQKSGHLARFLTFFIFELINLHFQSAQHPIHGLCLFHLYFMFVLVKQIKTLKKYQRTSRLIILEQ